MTREFAVTPPNLALVLALPGIALLIAVAGLLLAARDAPAALYAGLPILLGVCVLLGVAIFRRRVTLEGERLHVAAGINTARVDVAQLDLDAARIVDLDEHTEYKPGLKAFGSATPGYQAGHFHGLRGGRSFALVTDKRRVLVLPERSGRRLLLSLERPQALLDALRERLGRPGIDAGR